MLIVDDVLATGGTLNAAYQLIIQVGGTVAKSLVVVELLNLKGRDKIPGDVLSLVQY